MELALNAQVGLFVAGMWKHNSCSYVDLVFSYAATFIYEHTAFPGILHIQDHVICEQRVLLLPSPSKRSS